MEISLIILSFLIIITFMYLKMRLELHMMQLNSYRNGRYLKWLSNHILDKKRVIELVFLIILLLLTFLHFYTINYFIFCYIAFYSFLSFQYLKINYKKKLVLTSRALRLLCSSVILFLFFPVLNFLNLILFINFYIITSLVLNFSWFIICLANILIKPVEEIINKWYFNDAKRIISKMPDLIIIGITGSYGKTSTKHFLYRILSEKYNVLMTPGSYNTTMGVIRTIREELKPTHEVFIVEMGAKQPGDIQEICDLVKPKIGIITAIGEQHLDSFKTIERVQNTKFELVDSLPIDGLAVLNADYEYIAKKKINNTQIKYYSINDLGFQYSVNNIIYTNKVSKFTIIKDSIPIINLETKLAGNYNISNLLSAYIVSIYLGVKDESISYAIKKIKPVQHRLEIKVTNNNITIIDDAFNSNPLGAKMALDVLGQMKGDRKIIITPGMIELADKHYYYNQIFGEQIAEVCNYVILVGRKITMPIQNGLKNKNFPSDHVYIGNNFKEATIFLKSILRPFDVVLYENDLPDTYEQN